jgi:PIN domain nuclease of toxin-antitoxin system
MNLAMPEICGCQDQEIPYIIVNVVCVYFCSCVLEVSGDWVGNPENSCRSALLAVRQNLRKEVKMLVSTLPLSHACNVVEAAQERLRAVPCVSFRDLRCEYRHGLLVLQGRVQSYYEKQLAQEAVAGLEGVGQIVNELEVTWGDSNLQRTYLR